VTIHDFIPPVKKWVETTFGLTLFYFESLAMPPPECGEPAEEVLE
jgi:hypothetical protein